jgi:hypothetical protein
MLVNERTTESVVRSTTTQGGNSEPRSRPEQLHAASRGILKPAPTQFPQTTELYSKARSPVLSQKLLDFFELLLRQFAFSFHSGIANLSKKYTPFVIRSRSPQEVMKQVRVVRDNAP